MDRQRPEGGRLRRRHRGAHQRRRRGSGTRPGAGQADRVRQGADATAQPPPGDARRRPAVVRLVRLQRRLGARRRQHGRAGLGQHPHRHGGGLARLARGGEEARRARHLARRSVRCRRGPGRDHPGVLGGEPGRRDLRRRRRRCAVRARRRPEVQVRLRRLARRRRRAPGRRCRRHGADRHRRDGRRAGWRRRSPLRRRGRPAVAAGCRGRRGDGVLVRHGLRHRQGDRQDHRVPGNRGGRDHRHRPHDPRRDRRTSWVQSPVVATAAPRRARRSTHTSREKVQA